MAKKILKIISFFIIAVVGGIFSDQIFWPYFVERPLFYKYRLEQSPIYVTEQKEMIIKEESAVVEAIEKTQKAVIEVKTKTSDGLVLEGSGLIVTSDGLIITLAELVPKDSFFSFSVSGEQVVYQILKRNTKENLALIKVNKTGLSTVGFADISKLKLGERVFLVGSILNNKEQINIANQGIVRSFNQDLIETNIFEKVSLKGSPLFNVSGEVLGINTVDGYGRISAIPVSKIKEFIGF